MEFVAFAEFFFAKKILNIDSEPIILAPIRMSSGFQLWNEYLHRYHTLGCKHSFGAGQRYFILSDASQKRWVVFCLRLRPECLSCAMSGSLGVRLTAVCT
jgi:hypothetical protein